MAQNDSTTLQNEELLTGQVKWFNVKAGYGFITVVDEGDHKGKDIFVHYSALKVVNSQYRYLVQGEYVNFNIVKPESDKYEFHATDVSGIKGGPIMCETRRIANEGESRREPIRKYRTPSQGGRPPRDSATEPGAERDETAGFERVVRKREPRSGPPSGNRRAGRGEGRGASATR
jgi:cold shock CspA family protein